MSKYSKFFVALLGAVLATAMQFYSTNKYVQIAVVFATALGVYQVKNQ
jgi:hypothetical protein